MPVCSFVRATTHVQSLLGLLLMPRTCGKFAKQNSLGSCCSYQGCWGCLHRAIASPREVVEVGTPQQYAAALGSLRDRHL
jgi:hypothetical protein